MRETVLVILSGLWLLAIPQSASAQAAKEPSPATYAEHVERGLAAYASQRYAEALQAFEAAHAVSPNARTHRGIGIAALKLGHLLQAREHLQQALIDSRNALSAPLVDATRKALELAEAQLARVRVTRDAEASVLVDDAPAAHDDVRDEWLLEPGTHRIEARSPDGTRQQRTLELSSGQRAELDLRSAASAQAPAVAKVPAPAQAARIATARDDASAPSDGDGPSYAGPIVVTSLGAAALIAAAVTGWVAQSDADALDEACPDPERCDPSLQWRADRGATLRDTTNALLIAGPAAIATGLVWWLLTPSHESAGAASAPRASVALAPSSIHAQLALSL